MSLISNFHWFHKKKVFSALRIFIMFDNITVCHLLSLPLLYNCLSFQYPSFEKWTWLERMFFVLKEALFQDLLYCKDGAGSLLPRWSNSIHCILLRSYLLFCQGGLLCPGFVCCQLEWKISLSDLYKAETAKLMDDLFLLSIICQLEKRIPLLFNGGKIQ